MLEKQQAEALEKITKYDDEMEPLHNEILHLTENHDLAHELDQNEIF